MTWTTFPKDEAANEILERIEGIETLERANYDKIEKKITDGVLTVTGSRTGEGEDARPRRQFHLRGTRRGDGPRSACWPRRPAHCPASRAGALPFLTPPPATRCATAPDARCALASAPVLIGETAVWRIYLHYRPDEAWLRSPAAAFTRTQAEAIAAREQGHGQTGARLRRREIHQPPLAAELRVDFAQLPYALHRVQAE